MPIDRNDALLKEYEEVSSNFRMLTEIRFKLLAFLPVAAGVAAGVFADRNATVLTLAFSLFGLVVTIALATYNSRNDQLYDTLVARAAAIERRLGIPDGAFANRPRAWLRLGPGPKKLRLPRRKLKVNLSWNVDHRTGVATVYYASITLWVFGVLHAGIGIAPAVHHHQTSADLVALPVAIALTAIGARLVKAQRKETADTMRKLAAEAVRLASDPRLSVLDERFLSLCVQLTDAKKADNYKIKEVEQADIKKARPTDTRKAKSTLIRNEKTPTISEPTTADLIETRAHFLSRLQLGNPADYIADGSPEWRAAQIVASITDLPPEWLYDCATSRRRPSHSNEVKG